MNVPPKTNPRWTDIVTGKKTYTLKFLAEDIFLSRVVRTVSANPTRANVSEAIDQLYVLFEKNCASKSSCSITKGQVDCRHYSIFHYPQSRWDGIAGQDFRH